ncbi:ABC transporter permease subunit [Paenibacillus sp. JX-17]|uniref:ABC transporter permease subunit n=1 Tax=Paenibacillus lacisoli TaxID=3064525 RepID=A0ABT9CCK8_9BACL|nr:ABC transporter permease subunit [Paenibacillus sp. JX-17]MDO7906976.1 ABC transporter permease subunit [Paenibacillus sp. JX-17]
MRRLLAISKKELQAYLWTPTSYFALAIYMLLTGLLFYNNFVSYQPSILDYRLVLGDTLSMFLFIIPLLTMRLIAEEFRQGTDELLLTSPASVTEIIFGKYLASLAMLLVLILCSLFYPLIMSFFGPVNLTMILTSVIGLFLLGAGMMAIGLFASTLSQHQMIAAVAGFILMLAFWMMDSLGGSSDTGSKLHQWIDPFSLTVRFDSFAKGLLNGSDILYFVTLAGLFILLSIQVVERKRWR